MKRLRLLFAVLVVLALSTGAGTALAAPREDYTVDLTGSGSVSAGSVYFTPAYAVDNSGSTYWSSNTGVSSTWWQYDFGSGVAYAITQYTIQASTQYPANTPPNWTLYGSDTGAFAGEEVALDTQAGQSFTAGQVRTYQFTNAVDYRYYRFAFSGANPLAVAEIELMETIVPTPGYSADLCVGGTPTASDAYSGYPVSKAFDDNLGDVYRWASGTATGTHWVQYHFAYPVIIQRVVYSNYWVQAAPQDPESIVIKASATGTFTGEEVTLYSQTGLTWSSDTSMTFDFSNSTAYAYYRLYLTNDSYVAAREIEMMSYEPDPTEEPTVTPEITPTPVATAENIQVYVNYPTPVPQYFDPTANNGDGPEPWLLRFYVGVFVAFGFTYMIFRLVDTNQFYLLFVALCLAAAWVTKSVNGAAYVYIFMVIALIVFKLVAGLKSLAGGPK